MSRPRLTSRAGVSLVELVVALGILSTVLVALGGLMFQAARHTRTSAGVAYRSAASTAAGAWAQALPWDSLDNAVGCLDDTISVFPYTRCTTVTDPNARLKRLTIVISPTGVLSPRPDTVIVDRNKPRYRSTLNVN